MPAFTASEWRSRGNHGNSLLLDNNVWRYLSDLGEASIQEVRKASKASKIFIVACPAVVYEILRTPDRALRHRQVELITRNVWSRVMPEAYEEAAEIYRAVARTHPEWLAAQPRTENWFRLQADWQAGHWWKRARMTPDRESNLIDMLGGRKLEQAREDARTARQHNLKRGVLATSINMATDKGKFLSPTPGWNGEVADAWRIEGCLDWLRTLRGNPRSTPLDWLYPWISRDSILRQQEQWVQMWLYELRAAEMPLNWMRRALYLAATLRKVGDGTPVDIQIATYLPFVAHYVTADRRFMLAIESIRSDAPVPLAAGHLVPGGAKALPALLQLIEDLGAGLRGSV